jgi:hypothetical protein
MRVRGEKLVIYKDADISGMGNIEIYGNPDEVTKSDGWFSNITIH